MLYVSSGGELKNDQRQVCVYIVIRLILNFVAKHSLLQNKWAVYTNVTIFGLQIIILYSKAISK